jgi:hypothetical protein
MKYFSGEEIRLWDRVEPWGGCYGIVVFSIDTDEYSSQYPKEHWADLARGVMVDTDLAGLIHFDEADGDLTFVGRGGEPTSKEWADLHRGARASGEQ